MRVREVYIFFINIQIVFFTFFKKRWTGGITSCIVREIFSNKNQQDIFLQNFVFISFEESVSLNLVYSYL